MLNNSTQNEEDLFTQSTTNVITRYAATTTESSNVTLAHAEVIVTSLDLTTALTGVNTAPPDITTANADVTTTYDDITTANGNVITTYDDITTANADVTTTYDDITMANADVTTTYDDITTAHASHGFDVAIAIASTGHTDTIQGTGSIMKSTYFDHTLSIINGTIFSEVDVAEVTQDTAEGSSTVTVIMATVLLAITVVTIVGNILVIVSPLVDRKLRNTFTYYIINLGVTDFLVALSAMSFYSVDIMLGYWPFGEVMCGIWIFFDYGMTFASVFTLVVISLDRYWSVGWSLHYKSYNTPRKCAIMITIVWVGVFAVWLAPCILDRIRWSEAGVCKWEPSKNKEFVIFVAVVGHHIPCAVIIFCYVKIFSIMRAKKRTIAPTTSGNTTCNSNLAVPNQMQAFKFESSKSLGRQIQFPILPDNTTLFGNQANKHHDSGAFSIAGVGEKSTCNSSQDEDVYLTLARRQKKKEDREKKAFVMLSYILFSYLLCWLPFHIVFDVSSIRPDLVPEWIFTTTFWLTYCNSTINPFVYAFTSSSFRNAFMKIIKCRVCRQNIN